MKDVQELLHLSEEDCPNIWIRIPIARPPQHWDSIDAPAVPLERKLYGHPLAGLFVESKFEKVLIEE